MHRSMLVLSLAAALPLTALAQSSDTYQCTMGGLTRRVEVAHETSAPVPCEVRYHKDDEAPGAPQVLWSASNEAGYCESQAEGFVARLEGMGWQCDSAVSEGISAAPVPAEPPAAPAPAADAPPADDTDALAAPSERPPQ
ncbi:MAG TPA: hypothetical protein VIM81_06075 [Gammaproteobacteria bacterium]